MKKLLKANPGFQVLHFNCDEGATTRQDVIAWKRGYEGYFPVTMAGEFQQEYVLQPCGSVYLPEGVLFDNEDAARADWLRSVDREDELFLRAATAAEAEHTKDRSAVLDNDMRSAYTHGEGK